MEIETRRRRALHRPRVVRLPCVRSCLEHHRLPRGLRALAVEIVAEERRLDVLAELARRGMSAEWDEADAVVDGRVPGAVIPRAGDHQVRVLGIVLLRLMKDLPRPPR